MCHAFNKQDADSVISQVLSLLQSIVATSNQAVSLTSDAQALAAVKSAMYEPLPIEHYTITNADQPYDYTDSSTDTAK